MGHNKSLYSSAKIGTSTLWLCSNIQNSISLLDFIGQLVSTELPKLVSVTIKIRFRGTNRYLQRDFVPDQIPIKVM
jgi:hypothetical protein